MTAQENDLRFTIHVKTYGEKRKCVRDVGLALSRALYLQFGDRFTIVDHRSQPISYDPGAPGLPSVDGD